MSESAKRNNTYCCVPQCKSRGTKNPDLSFHLFPNVKSKIPVISANGNKTLVSRRSEWIRLLKIGKEVSSRMTVCSKHFTPNDYSVTTGMFERARLKPYAVPSCFLPQSSIDKARNSKKMCKAAIRELRYEEINRKRDHTTGMCSSSASIAIEANSADSSDNINDETFTTPENTSAAETLAAEVLLGLNNPQNVETPMSDKGTQVVFCAPETRNVGTQVISGDLELPYLIQASKLTDKQLKSLTGLRSKELLDNIAESVNLEIKITNKHILPIKERIISVFMKIKLDISFVALAVFFGCSDRTISNIFSELVPVLASLFESLIIFPPKEVITANLPNCFTSFSDVRVVLDCTEISVDKPKCLNERISTWSQYKGRHTLKYMVGTSPGGVIVFVSKSFGGRTSDKYMFLDSGLVEMLDPCTDALMSDKGFLIDEACQDCCIKLIRPPFLKQNGQFSRSEALSCKKIARARVHVERVIQRLKTFRILKNTIPHNVVHLMDKIIMIIVGLTNLSRPVLEDDKYKIKL